MAIVKKDMISYFTFDCLDKLDILHGIFMRHGGCSPQPWCSLNMATSGGDSMEHTIENRHRLSVALGISEDSFFDVWQVHSNKVVYAQKPRKIGENHIKADAIMTDKKDVSILMLFADCVPVLFYDPDKEVIACAHAGWQGTFNKIAAETVKSMRDTFSCKPENIIAAIGPSICQDHYEVGENVVQAAERVFGQTNEVIKEKDHHYYANLQLANQLILQEAGVNKVEQSGICTMCNNQDWFSHRAENGSTGRFGAVITLKKKK